MDKITFQDGVKQQDAYVTVNGQNLTVTPAKYTSPTPFSAQNLNLLQNYIEQAIAQAKQEAKEEAILEAHPVGSLYWSKNSTNPSELFGGTWQQIKDVFILASGDTYEVDSTGGSATHKLTTNEMPSHTHTFKGTASSHSHTLLYNAISNKPGGAISGLNGGDLWNNGVDLNGSTNSTSITPRGTNSSTGGGQAFSIMPPYKTRYCWERIA